MVPCHGVYGIAAGCVYRSDSSDRVRRVGVQCARAFECSRLYSGLCIDMRAARGMAVPDWYPSKGYAREDPWPSVLLPGQYAIAVICDMRELSAMDGSIDLLW